MNRRTFWRPMAWLAGLLILAAAVAWYVNVSMPDKRPFQFTGFFTNRFGKVDAEFYVPPGTRDLIMEFKEASRKTPGGVWEDASKDFIGKGYGPGMFVVPVKIRGESLRLVFKVHERTVSQRWRDRIRRIRSGRPGTTLDRTYFLTNVVTAPK